MPVKKLQPPRSLDLAELEQMVEPLTVQIQRLKNGNYSPIPLPTGDSGIAGVGWSKAEVQTIDGGWLVNEWAGGGYYEITVTDDTKPVPRKMTWKPYWNVADFPEKIPPTLMSGARPDLVAAQIQPIPVQPQQVQQPMAQFPNGLPGGGLMPAPGVVPQPQAYYQPQQVYYQPQPQPYSPALAAQAQADSDRRRLEEKLAAMETALRQSQLEAAQKQHQAELERVRAENKEQLQRLEQRIAELMTGQSNKPNAEIEALREQTRLQQQQIEAERRERDAERREREMRDMVAAQNTQIQRQIESMQQNFTVLQQAAQNRGPDPMIQMMMEQNRNSLDAMKEIARQSSTAVDKLQTFMMSPRDVMAITKDASSGLDGMAQKIQAAFGSALDMQQKVLEQHLQLQGGGNETIGLIREGVSTVKDMAERYMITKGREAQAAHQSQAVVAQAQAQQRAIEAQAQVALAQTQVQAARTQPGLGGTSQPSTPRPAQPTPQPAPAPQAQHMNNVSAIEEWRRKRDVEAPPSLTAQQILAQAHLQQSQQQTQQPASQPARPSGARSDLEWFGPLTPQVAEVRTRVASFLNDLDKYRKDPTKTPTVGEDAATPENVAKGIAAALGIVMQQQIPIPAITELLGQGMYEEFFKILLPAAPDVYRADCIVELKKILGEVDEEDEAEDDFEDGEDHDDVRDGASA